MVVEIDHDEAGPLTLVGTPVRLYGTPSSWRLQPPELGQHTVAVLNELGYSEAEITRLKEAGALG
jgi:succinate--hydroxymethylglutarate CoA-transferase